MSSGHNTSRNARMCGMYDFRLFLSGKQIGRKFACRAGAGFVVGQPTLRARLFCGDTGGSR
jgi:hypothetical protein